MSNVHSNVNVDERIHQLATLDQLITSTRERIESMARAVGWSMELIEKEEEEEVSCPLNSGHRMPSSSLERHMEKCVLHAEGYDSSDEFLSPSEFSSSPAVLIDKDTQARILQDAAVLSASEIKELHHVPRTFSRNLVELTAAERSALHDYVLSETRREVVSTLAVEDLHLPVPEDKTSRPKTKLELLAEQRDAKRRRTNYKKVHSGRKSYTEVLRELIGNQMEHLKSQDNLPLQTEEDI